MSRAPLDGADRENREAAVVRELAEPVGEVALPRPGARWPARRFGRAGRDPRRPGPSPRRARMGVRRIDGLSHTRHRDGGSPSVGCCISPRRMS